MELAIHTYGHIDSMFYVLNAIAMLMNHNFGNEIVMLISLVSVAYYAVRMSYMGLGYKAHLAKVLGMVAMIHFMLIPRADMIIYDHVSKKKEKVDNLPLGFALPVGLLESFGDLLTGGFEQAFTAIDNTNYRDYGMVFGARLLQESRNWRIRSPEFMENMSSFIDRCVMVDAMIGYNYTPEELLKTDDIWRLVKDNASTLRQATMRVGKTRSFMSCREAATNVIEPAFRSEIEALNTKYNKRDIGEAGTQNYVARTFQRMLGGGGVLNANLRKNIEIAFKGYTGINIQAETLVRQQMMMNAIKNYSDDYGYARASATQESNWRIAGDLAGTYLPILMSVIKGLVYSSFIFMLPLLIMSGGWSRYLSYLTLVASFQLWAPLNSVLNMFIDVYSSTTLQGIADNIVSFSTASRIGNYTDKIVAVASGLQMAIPFLAFSLMQGGVNGFIHLAGTITGVSQSAAAGAANESVTGNKSFDNYSVGNQQLYNMGGFKTDWNESYAAGASSYQHMDGSMERVTAGGNTLFQSGMGLTASSGATTYKQEDSRQAQVTEGTQAAQSLHEQDVRSFSEAKSNTMSKASDYISHLAQREHTGESFNYDSMGEQGESLRQAVNHAKELHDKRGYGWEQAGSMSAEVAASVGFKPFGIGASATTTGRLSANNTSDQSFTESTNVSRGNSVEQSKNNLIKAASNSSWAQENSIDTGYSDSVRQSYEEQQRLERQASISQQRVDDWHHAKSVVDSQGASSSRDMYQEVVEGIKQQYGVDGHTAHKMADSRSPQAQRVWRDIQNDDHYVQNVVANIGRNRAGVSGVDATHKLDKFTNEHNQQVSQGQDAQSSIKQHAVDNGMHDMQSVESFRDSISQQKQALEQQHKEITTESAVQYNAVNKYNKMEESRVQKRVDKYEEDRIGQGIASKIIGGAAKVGSLGTQDARIGGPDKYQDMNTNTSTPTIKASDNVIDEVEQQKANNVLSKIEEKFGDSEV